ncbi:MAG: DUF3565 domain-containing protein [Acidimicrobiales bacterium]
MRRAITSFRQDDAGDWVAELSCGHDQHVRHRPPFQVRPWVVEASGRASRLGAPLECPLCDRAELPAGLRLARTTPEWDEVTMPAGLRRDHRVAGGTWGRIAVRSGRLRFVLPGDPGVDVEVVAGAGQAIPPEMTHHVEPIGSVRFAIDFLAVGRDPADPADP